MSISVKRHEIWCTVGDMRMSKWSIIIITINVLKNNSSKIEHHTIGV